MTRIGSMVRLYVMLLWRPQTLLSWLRQLESLLQTEGDVIIDAVHCLVRSFAFQLDGVAANLFSKWVKSKQHNTGYVKGSIVASRQSACPF